jgi:hemerythrin superfamily protein
MTIRKEEISGKDIVELILVDHKPLKELIKILKKPDGDDVLRFEAFETFAPLLLAHAEPEEMSLYEFMKKDKEMLVDALEGDTEHSLASQLIDEIRATEDKNLWSAKVKVLAEMVEHHIKEEEGSMLPDFRKTTTLEERILLGDEYSQLKSQANNTSYKSNESEFSPAHN